MRNAPVTNVIKDANDERLSSGRIALLYKPSEDFSILATAMTQTLRMGGYDLLDGSPDGASPSRVYDAHYEAFPLRESVRDAISLFGLTLNANVGFADLTSATSYWSRLGDQTQDASESIYLANGRSTQFISAVPYSERDPSRQLSQEIRLTSHDVGGLHWVAGAFYSDLHSIWNEIGFSPDNASPAIPDGAYFISWNQYHVTQTALFGDGSYKFTDQWKLSAGVRWYTYKSEQDEYSWGYDGPNATPPAASQVTKASDRGFNPRVNLSYTPTPDFTAYATVSKGFRPGGANQILPPPTSPPFCQNGALQFGPDAAWNYEIGEKAKLFDNWLTINSDIYYIKWTGIQQVITLPCGYQYYNNAGDGRSFGPELEINAKLTSELDRLAHRRLHRRENHPSERGLHRLPDQRRRFPGRCHSTLPDRRRRLHRAHHECHQGHRQPVAVLCQDHHDRLPAHGTDCRCVRGSLVRCGLLLRLQAALLQHRQCPRRPGARQLDRRPVRRQPGQQSRIDDRQQHQLPVQHTAARCAIPPINRARSACR